MGKAGSPLTLVLRPHLVADGDGIDRGVVILRDDHAKAVGELRIGKLNRLERRLRSGNHAQERSSEEGREQTVDAHVTWQDDSTLKVDTDAGTQTRLLNFDRAKTAPAEKSWQGFSVAEWQGPQRGRGAGPPPTPISPTVPGGGGSGLRGGPPPTAAISEGGSLKVVTTRFRDGYLRKNGVPYSEDASITEYFDRLPPHPNGDVWLLVLTVIEDPKYLTQPFYTSTHFKLERDGTKWNPTPCRTDPPAK